MRGASRDSLAAAQERLEPLLARGGASALGQELYAVAGLLRSGSPRRYSDRHEACNIADVMPWP